jgi:23S rRNA pseudouridine1911/1915/1917 synthase
VNHSISQANEDKVTFNVTTDDIGRRLDHALTRFFELIPSRSFAQKLIEAQAVLVNGQLRKSSWLLRQGDVIEVDLTALRPPPAVPQPQAIPLEIIFEDSDILVINKPAGLVVHPGAGVPDGTLVNAVLAHTGATLPSLGDPLRAGLVHRLDRDTSGVMVVAKSQRALTELSRQFAEHAQLRRYHALVFGEPKPGAQAVETWHGRDPNHRLRYAVLPQGHGKIARMQIKTEKVFADGKASLVVCELYTGRTHQIRVQMAHLGHGLLGDAMYGAAASSSAGTAALMRDKALWAKVRALATRQMLHAAVLGITHPTTGERLLFETQPPQDFQVLEKMLSDFAEQRI